MTCPQCNTRIPVKSLLASSGVVCHHCGSVLCPRASCTIFLFVVSFGLGFTTLLLLRRNGAELWLSLAAFFLVVTCVYAALAPLVVRFRLKDETVPNLPRRSA
ncbi:MAG: hypothetical protein WBP79_06045 [Candidatus Acidiferrales bacterium]